MSLSLLNCDRAAIASTSSSSPSASRLSRDLLHLPVRENGADSFQFASSFTSLRCEGGQRLRTMPLITGWEPGLLDRCNNYFRSQRMTIYARATLESLGLHYFYKLVSLGLGFAFDLCSSLQVYFFVSGHMSIFFSAVLL